MLDILEIAKEEGLKEGKALERVETTQEMVVEVLLERFDLMLAHISEQIRRIHNVDVLKGLHRHAIKCKDLQEFETRLKQMS